jgi:uncharacterized protein YndB with AHSA1/START domain
MKPADKETVTIETIIHASVDDVWKAWTFPAAILNWFGSDPNGKVLEASLDVIPGGNFEITFKDGDETKHTCSGEYTTVEAFSKLSFSWEWKNEPGIMSFVTILFTPENNYTLMHFEHANLGYASKHNYLTGWQNTFLKLDKLLTKKI